MAIDNKKAAIEMAMKKIQKDHGEGSIMKMGDRPIKKLAYTSSDILSLDLALGIGGYPKGRIIEIYGPESSGKTTVSLHAVAQAQAVGGIAAFVDAEHALDPAYAQKLGVDVDEMLLSQPDTGEQALEIVEALVRSNAVSIIVVDSVAALTPKAEIEGEMGQSHMGVQARLMSQALRKLAGVINQSQTTVIFINQVREKIGVMFGNPETTPGGRALKFYASVRLEVRRAEQIKSGNDVTGNRTKIKVVKNKVAPPFRTAELDIMYGQGVSKEGDVLDLGVQYEVVEKSGSWYSFNGNRLGQGRENSKELLRTNPEILDEIRQLVLTKAGLVVAEVEAE